MPTSNEVAYGHGHCGRDILWCSGSRTQDGILSAESYWNTPATYSLQREISSRNESATSFKSPLSKLPRPKHPSVSRAFPSEAVPIGR